MSDLGYHEGYKYPHDYPHHFTRQAYMPETIGHPAFWNPCHNPAEDKLAQRQHELWNSED